MQHNPVPRCESCGTGIPEGARTCVACEERLRPGTTVTARRNRFLRWVSATHSLILWAALIGLLLQAVGLLKVGAGGSWGLALGGTLILSIALTVEARRKNRSWLWGLLGFLGIIGLVFVLPLWRRCGTCRRRLPPEEATCVACHGPAGYR